MDQIKLPLFAFSAFLLSKRPLGGKKTLYRKKVNVVYDKRRESGVRRILNMGGGVDDLESGCGR